MDATMHADFTRRINLIIDVLERVRAIGPIGSDLLLAASQTELEDALKIAQDALNDYVLSELASEINRGRR